MPKGSYPHYSHQGFQKGVFGIGEDRLRALAEAYRGGMSFNEVARKYEASFQTIRRALLFCGYRARPKHFINKLGKSGIRGKVYTSGYVLVQTPNHPRADRKGYVLEHILIWERAHGKPLPIGMVIHHLNGIRNDNRMENLLGVTIRDHHRLMEPYKKRIRELETEISNLRQGKIFSPERSAWDAKQ